MFESITESLAKAFRTVLGKARLSEENIADAVREVRTALLEADVNVKAADAFVERVSRLAIGAEVIPGVDPGQLFVKTVYDGMVELLGGQTAGIAWEAERPTVVMLCGLQGSGKTTTAAKLARKWKAEGRSPLLVAADVQRPAAVAQLQTLGEQIGVPVFARPGQDPVAICRSAAASAAAVWHADTVILDTAGRLHVDAALMGELEAIRQAAAPAEILFVCDAMIGQSAVDTAEEFKRRLPLSGAVMTKMDSDARGGGALSLRESTGVPIKFIASGEKMDALEEFHPDRMASRILGMGDVVSLVERAQAVIDEKEARALQEKLAKNRFDLNDFLNQLASLRKMGSFKDILSLIPGLGSSLKNADLDESQFKRFECVIQSMTMEERRNPEIIDNRRRERIARGSGRQIRDVADLLKQFQEMRKIAGRMGRLGIFSGGGQTLENMDAGTFSGLASGRSLYGSKKKGSKAQKKKKDRKKEKKKKRRR
ncbi:MAG: signal recognition particle protein [Planctomycetota bacterium]|jgi:signal recognition particle subunit SRP54|nr:signal recognition particle protein [Planctomycetota bacterium]